MERLGFTLAAVACLLLAGCTGTTDTATSRGPRATLEPWTPLACDASAATQVGNNVRLVAGQVGIADTIAKRVAQGLGDPVTGAAEPYEDSPFMRWPTGQGHVIMQMVGESPPPGARAPGTFLSALYQKPSGSVPPSQIREMVESLGVAPSTLNSTAAGGAGQIWQEWNGTRVKWEPVTRSGAHWFMPQSSMYTFHLNVGPFYDFLLPKPVVAGQAAQDAARGFMRCQLDREGKTEARGYRMNHTAVSGFAVVGQGLAYLVGVHYSTVGYSPCGNWDSRWVFVDAVTGAVRHTQLAPCYDR